MSTLERLDSGHALPDDQGVNVVGPLIGLHRFQVHQVAHDGVVVGHPVAPRMSRERRAHSSAIQTLLRLAMEMCWCSTLPASLRRPTCSTSNCALVISLIIQASFSCTNWWEAMGWSRNCLRSREYCKAQS